MSQINLAWGRPPSADYEALAERFRPIFQRIRTGAVSRDFERRLPTEEIHWLREAGFTALPIPPAMAAVVSVSANCSPCWSSWGKPSPTWCNRCART